MYTFTTKLEPFARGFLSCNSIHKCKKVAAGFLQAAKEMPISFDLDKGFVHTMFSGATGLTGHANLFCNEESIDRLILEHPDAKADLMYIKEQMAPMTRHRNMRQFFSAEQLAHWDAGHLWAGAPLGHVVPNLADIALYGTDYFRAKAESCRVRNPGKDAFYDSILTTMDALDILGGRICAEAEAALSHIQDQKHRQNLLAIRDTFRAAPKLPCTDFVQASIVFSWIFLFDGYDSPGHFDQYMYPLWKVTDPVIRRRYLEALWEMFHETRTWNLCISGSDENWNDLTNELTYEILDLTAKYKYNTPNLTMRCHKNTPEALLRAAYKAISTGCGMPALYNDEAVCAALERLGIPPCDSHRYVMNGCNQIDIQGKSHMGLEDGEIVLPRALEFVLYNGIVPKTGRDLGLHTGDPKDFETFDQFYAAFLMQLDNMIRITCEMSNCGQHAFARETVNPFRNALLEGCLEKGLDYKAGGPLYGHGQILAQGIADTADALAAIKKYVYEDRLFTMAQLIDALDKDFEGYEDLYLTLRNSPLKFGNDNDYVDAIAVDVVNHFNRMLLTIPTVRGGYFSGGCSPYIRAPRSAKILGALPNGKRRDSCQIADSIGATPGFDTNGPTALMNSCVKFDHTLPGSGFILNLKFDKALFCSQQGVEHFMALSRAYFRMGGQMLTFTVVSEEELLDAKLHPENHRDLIVRVGGYSDYFTDLEPELQDNVIARTRHAI